VEQGGEGGGWGAHVFWPSSTRRYSTAGSAVGASASSSDTTIRPFITRTWNVIARQCEPGECCTSLPDSEGRLILLRRATLRYCLLPHGAVQRWESCES
jgi:hypothetical protein